MNKPKILFQLFFTVLLCVVIESMCWLTLRQQHQSVGFLFNLKIANKIHNAERNAPSNQIDPTAGGPSAMPNYAMPGLK